MTGTDLISEVRLDLKSESTLTQAESSATKDIYREIVRNERGVVNLSRDIHQAVAAIQEVPRSDLFYDKSTARIVVEHFDGLTIILMRELRAEQIAPNAAFKIAKRLTKQIRRMFRAFRDAGGNKGEPSGGVERLHGSLTDDGRDPEGFFDEVRLLDEADCTDEALDLIFDRLDDLLLEGNFAAVDDILRIANVDDLSLTVLLGLLTVTLPAKDKLSERARFYTCVEHSLSQRGQLNADLLVGLE